MEIHQANAYGKDLIAQHLPGSDWVLRWDRADHRAGVADFEKGRIVLSVSAVEQYQPQQVEQLMLHEIAHVIAGPTGHDKQWKKAARAIGYEGGEHCDDFTPKKGISLGGLVAWIAFIVALLTVVFPVGIAAAVVFGLVILSKFKKQFNTVEKNIGLAMNDEGEWE